MYAAYKTLFPRVAKRRTANSERRTENLSCDPGIVYASGVQVGRRDAGWQNAIGKGIFTTTLTGLKPVSRGEATVSELAHEMPL